MKRRILFSIIALVIIIAAAFIFFKKEILAPTEQISKNEISNISSSEENNLIKVKLLINGKGSGEISVPKNSTVFKAMEIAASSSIISFKSKNYPGLGDFIDEINGIKSSGNKYWILYVNGKLSSVGASQYTLSPNDTIEWKFESAK